MARRKQKRTRRKPNRKRAGHRRNIARMRAPAKNPFRSPYNMNLQSLEIIRENNRRTQEEFAKAWDNKNMSHAQAWENKAVQAMADLRRARAEAKLLAAHSVTPITPATPSGNPAPGSPPPTELRPHRGVQGGSRMSGAELRESAEAIRGGRPPSSSPLRGRGGEQEGEDDDITLQQRGMARLSQGLSSRRGSRRGRQ